MIRPPTATPTPTAPAPAPAPAPAAGPARPGAIRWLICWVLLCIGFQAFLAPGQRTAERAHFHRDAGYLPERAKDQPDHHQDHTHGGNHVHLYLAIHGHDHADAHDLVYVSANDAQALSGQANGLKRATFDQDGVGLHEISIAVGLPASVGFAESALTYRSHVTLPLDRPPCRRG